MNGRIVYSDTDNMILKIERGDRIVRVYRDDVELQTVNRSLEIYGPFITKSVPDALNSVYGAGGSGKKSKITFFDALNDAHLVVPLDETGGSDMNNYKLDDAFKKLLSKLLPEFN